MTAGDAAWAAPSSQLPAACQTFPRWYGGASIGSSSQLPSLRTGRNHRREDFKKRAARAADTHRQLVPSVEGGSVQYKCGTAARRRLVKKSYRVRPRERTTTTQRAVAQEASFKTKPKKKNISTVRLLEAGARAVATKLLRLTPTGVRNEQAAVVRKEQVLDLLLGCLVHVCELQSP